MAVKFKDYYKTLGVERSATQEDIKQAFRKLARVHHPDVAKNKAAGEAKFKEVNEAYEVLGDSEKRQRYDELGANWQDAGGGQDGQETYGRGRASWSRRGPGFEFGGTGFRGFFESFFGGADRGVCGSGRSGDIRPRPCKLVPEGARLRIRGHRLQRFFRVVLRQPSRRVWGI